ncbi:Yip1 family protein [Pseudorhodobacter sp.]|uniref:Yip1 family protein n=1 Tax=Pseudorhodobacter sp. TaxID=1934400 RepID=UPI0026491998|nr:Yip1 family protein [Pseudorhodobacter sp.]MDN5788678.1 YIP1 family protein [Pseudorhodobacter sp.]
MSVTTDITRAWRNPRAVMRGHLARDRSEPWAFALLVAFMVVAFIAQWPGASRNSFYNPEVPMVAQLFGLAMGILVLIPVWYLLAAISHWIARVFGGKGNHYGARLALFWALVTVSPLMLLQGLVKGMIGPSGGLTAVSVLTGVAFVVFWMLNLIEAER